MARYSAEECEHEPQGLTAKHGDLSLRFTFPEQQDIPFAFARVSGARAAGVVQHVPLAVRRVLADNAGSPSQRE